jgi:hypothetical protein
VFHVLPRSEFASTLREGEFEDEHVEGMNQKKKKKKKKKKSGNTMRGKLTLDDLLYKLTPRLA